MKSLGIMILFVCNVFSIFPTFAVGKPIHVGTLTAQEPIVTVPVVISKEVKQWIQQGMKNRRIPKQKRLDLELVLGPRTDDRASLFRIFLDDVKPKSLNRESAINDSVSYVETFSFFEGEKQAQRRQTIIIDMGERIFTSSQREKWIRQGNIPIQIVLKRRMEKDFKMKQDSGVSIESAQFVLHDNK